MDILFVKLTMRKLLEIRIISVKIYQQVVIDMLILKMFAAITEEYYHLDDHFIYI